VTLYDQDQTQIAQNDDPVPRMTTDAQLLTVLPADGTYYIRVADCNEVIGPAGCAPAAGILHDGFKVSYASVDLSTSTGTTGEAEEPNDTPGTAADIKYHGYNGGLTFGISVVTGAFDSPSDVDVFTIKLPTATPVDAGARAHGNVYPLPWGPDGDGSSAPLGKFWIVDPDDLTHRLAEFDPGNGVTGASLSAPLTLDKEYYLFVSRASGTAGTNEFYYLTHFGHGLNPVEVDEGAGTGFVPLNDTPGTAQALTLSGTTDYFIEGDISASQDVDYFSAAMPAGLADQTVRVTCSSQHDGSGLRGFKLSVFRSDGTTLLVTTATATEDATTRISLSGLALGSETTGIVLRVEATLARDPNVTGTYYTCGMRFK